MKIHALQTGVVQVKTAFLTGSAAAGGTLPFLFQLHKDDPYVEIPIYAWLIEHPEKLILVDTGDLASLHSTWLIQTRQVVQPEQQIGAQIARLGYSVSDISCILLTHIHGDHAHGVQDFPSTPIYVSQKELNTYHSTAGKLINRMTLTLPTWFDPQPIPYLPEPVGVFEESHPLTKDGAIRVVPTPGHTLGHQSVIVRDGELSYFLAGDVNYDERGLLEQTLQGPVVSTNAQRQTLAKVLQYMRDNPTVYLPSHDPASAQRLAAGQVVPKTQMQVVIERSKQGEHTDSPLQNVQS
jgi:glyoxylase-like metal-dependent hydrolase (beta-lactamase superfamily II)